MVSKYGVQAEQMVSKLGFQVPGTETERENDQKGLDPHTLYISTCCSCSQVHMYVFFIVHRHVYCTSMYTSMFTVAEETVSKYVVQAEETVSKYVEQAEETVSKYVVLAEETVSKYVVQVCGQ